MTILQAREQKGIELGVQQGMEKGIEKGMEKGLKIVAKSMIVEGEPTDKIIRYTGLTQEEIGEIKKEMLS